MKHFFTPRKAASIAVVLWSCISQKNFQNSGENCAATLSTKWNHASCTQIMSRERFFNCRLDGRGNLACYGLCFDLRQNISSTIIPAVTIGITVGTGFACVGTGFACVGAKCGVVITGTAAGTVVVAVTGTQLPRPRRASCKQICLLPTIFLKQTGHVHETSITCNKNKVQMYPMGVDAKAPVIDGSKPSVIDGFIPLVTPLGFYLKNRCTPGV